MVHGGGVEETLLGHLFCFSFILIVICFFVEPNFVGSYEYGDNVFVFFREVATEHINCGKVNKQCNCNSTTSPRM